MSRLLLDTTFLIDADRSGGDLDAIIDDDDDVAIAAVTVAELRVGARLARGRHKAKRVDYVADVIATIPILSYDLAVAEAHADLLVAVRAQGRPRGAHDLIIAATARAFDLSVVSADAAAFEDLPGVNTRTHR
jgi:tRNA(fMet)-specific endonuclease VapC